MDFTAMASELRTSIGPGAAIIMMLFGGLGTVALLGSAFLKLTDSHATLRDVAIPGVGGIIVGGLTYVFSTNFIPAIIGA